MINRVIKDNEVYYAIADLCEMFSCSKYKMNKAIKDADIQCIKIFGNTRFVKEEDIDLICIDETFMTTKTIVRDFQEEFKSEFGFAEMIYQFHNVGLTREEILKQVFEKKEKEYNDANENSETNTLENEEKKAMREFNEICKKNGYSERVHKIVTKDCERRDLHKTYIIVRGNGALVGTDIISAVWNKKNLENGFIVEENGNTIELTKGKPKLIDEVEILKTLLFDNKFKYIIESDDYIVVETEKGAYISISNTVYFDLIHNKVRIIKNDLEEELLENLKEEIEEN